MSQQASQQCCVWDSYKYTLYTKLREPKLYRFAAQGDWDRIPARCQSHPKEASFVHRYAPMDTALGRLVRTGSSCMSCSPQWQSRLVGLKYQAAAALVKAHVEAANLADTFRRTPLHWAMMDVAGNHDVVVGEGSIVLLLLERAPQALCQRDLEGRTPLHYLVARNAEIPVDLLAKVVALYPEALGIKDDVGDTPVEILMSRREEVRDADELVAVLQKLEQMLRPKEAAPQK